MAVMTLNVHLHKCLVSGFLTTTAAPIVIVLILPSLS